MKSGLSILGYPHRTTLENVAFFADCGFESLSILGSDMDAICGNDEQSKELAEIIKDKAITLTVHHQLPIDHSEEKVNGFKESMKKVGEWQKRYGLIEILSFDVFPAIRDNVKSYVDFVLKTVPESKIALEDFGLNEAERKQIEHLKGNERFGYLLDIGHMYIRICGRNHCGIALATNSPDECPVTSDPGFNEFIKAFRSKDFPIFEIHLHNNDGKDDYHYFLEDGTLDCKMIADVLKEIKYDGVVTIESAPGFHFKCEYPESDERAKNTFAYWKKFING